MLGVSVQVVLLILRVHLGAVNLQNQLFQEQVSILILQGHTLLTFTTYLSLNV